MFKTLHGVELTIGGLQEHSNNGCMEKSSLLFQIASTPRQLIPDNGQRVWYINLSGDSATAGREDERLHRFREVGAC